VGGLGAGDGAGSAGGLGELMGNVLQLGAVSGLVLGELARRAPGLNPDGSANPSWLTSSAWDLDRRIVASELIKELF
jgi:hypothetical protein